MLVWLDPAPADPRVLHIDGFGDGEVIDDLRTTMEDALSDLDGALGLGLRVVSFDGEQPSFRKLAAGEAMNLAEGRPVFGPARAPRRPGGL